MLTIRFETDEEGEERGRNLRAEERGGDGKSRFICTFQRRDQHIHTLLITSIQNIQFRTHHLYSFQTWFSLSRLETRNHFSNLLLNSLIPARTFHRVHPSRHIPRHLSDPFAVVEAREDDKVWSSFEMTPTTSREAIQGQHTLLRPLLIHSSTRTISKEGEETHIGSISEQFTNQLDRPPFHDPPCVQDVVEVVFGRYRASLSYSRCRGWRVEERKSSFVQLDDNNAFNVSLLAYRVLDVTICLLRASDLEYTQNWVTWPVRRLTVQVDGLELWDFLSSLTILLSTPFDT
jgi:hypothetical protein